MKRSLIIWVEDVGTLKFENVRDFSDDKEVINFTYDGVSTNETRAATFNKSKLVGYAFTKEGNKHVRNC